MFGQGFCFDNFPEIVCLLDFHKLRKTHEKDPRFGITIGRCCTVRLRQKS